MKALLSICFILTCIAQGVYAQAVISGTVLDEYGEPTYGVNVVVDGTEPTIGTTTDLDGKYRLEIAEGSAGSTVALTFSYVGYPAQTIPDVILTAGKVTFLDVTLDPEGGVELEVATVTAKALRNTDVALTVLRSKSDKMLDGISSQQMAKLALSDAAGALTKVTGTSVVDGKFIIVRGLGDRYSTAQLNGLEMPSTDPYRNSPQLDLVPASLLDNIVTSKTFSPDQPGAFTGGNVNLVTKDFPEQERFTVAVTAGYNTIATGNDNFLRSSGGKNDYFGYDDGSRQLPARLAEIGRRPVPAGGGSTGEVNVLTSEVVRLLVNDEANRPAFALVEEASDLFDTDYSTFTQAPPLNHTITLSYGNQKDLGTGKRLGYTFSGRFGQNYSHYDNGTRAIYVLDDRNAEVLNTAFNLQDANSSINPSVNGYGSLSFRIAEGNTINFLAVYNHDSNISSRVLAGDAPTLNTVSPDRFINTSINFIERTTLTGQLQGEHALVTDGSLRLHWAASVTQSSQAQPDFKLFAYTEVNSTTPSGAQIQSANYSRPQNFFRDLSDELGEVKLDVFKDFTGGHKLQIGGDYKNKTRSFTERIFETQSVTRNEIYRFDGNPALYFSDQNSGFLDSTARSRPGRLVPGVSNFVVDGTLLANSYDGNEEISSVYAMGTYRVLPQLRAILGARYEYTNIRVESRDQTLLDDKRLGLIEGGDLLPSINLVYSPSDKSNFRASFTQTLARPNMREIAQFPSFDFVGGPTFSGNPNLEKSNITNYDLRYEFFPGGNGILSASGFYKDFKNPIVSTFLAGSGLEFTYTNVETAKVYGVELEAGRDFGFLNTSLRSLSGGVNLSFINSTSQIDSAEAGRIGFNTRPLQGQSPILANANLSWDPLGGNYDVTVAFNYFGNRLAFNGTQGTPDVYERGRGSLDLTASRTFGNFTIRAAANNLLNPKYTTFAEYKGNDFVFTEFRRGQTFRLTLGYTFQK